MPDFSRSIIYTIRTGDSVYVGSTTNFRRRKCDHKTHIYNENDTAHHYKVYKTIRANGYEWDMKPYKEYPCETKLQLEIEEERIRRELNAELNSQCCGTGLSRSEYKKQYRTDNKDKISEQKKQYYTDNKDKISEQQKRYNEKNKNKIAEQKKQYYTDNKDKSTEYIKKWKENNKDKIAKYTKKHYTNNKDKIRENKTKKVTCECGCIVSKGNLSIHKKTKKHLDCMEIINSV